MPDHFILSCAAFTPNGRIPEGYAYKGSNHSPALEIRGAPAGTAAFAIIMHDPDAPYGDFIHWLAWNIPAHTHTIKEGSMPRGTVQGRNDFGHNRYDGPAPPSGTHHYLFDFYALDEPLTLPEGAPEEDLRLMITRRAIAKTSLTGLYAVPHPQPLTSS